MSGQAPSQPTSFSSWLQSPAGLRTIQAGSGLAFGSFLSLHLTSLIGANYGPFFYDESLNAFRKFYQNPAIEIAIVGGSLALHSAAGILSRVQRGAESEKQKDLAETLHELSGWTLLAGVGAHFFATRFHALVYPALNYEADFSLMSWAVETYPYLAYPGYAAWSLAGFFHLSYGFLRSLSIYKLIKYDSLVKARRHTAFWAYIVLGGLGMVASVASFGRHGDAVSRERYPLWTKFHSLSYYFPSVISK